MVRWVGDQVGGWSGGGWSGVWVIMCVGGQVCGWSGDWVFR